MKYVSIDFKKYRQIDVYSRENGIFEYQAINPQNEEIRKNHNNFFLKISKWNRYQHIGEYIASTIAKSIGFKCCDVNIYKEKLEGSMFPITGTISYVETSKFDKILTPRDIVKTYRKTTNSQAPNQWVYSVDTILNATFKKMQEEKRPYDEFLRFKQDLINMIMFDIKFMNPDRDESNWLIRQSAKSGEIDLYPMFDNAAILGLEMDVALDSRGGDHQLLVDRMDRLRPYLIVTQNSEISGKTEESYDVLLRYILSKYPEQAKKSLKAVNSFTTDDLKSQLEDIDELDIERKKFVIDLFNQRGKRVNEIYQEFRSKES